MRLEMTDKISLIISDEMRSFVGGIDFSVRKASSIFADGCYWIYADIVPLNHPYWPDSYDTSIGLFSSVDCKDWKYHGIILANRDENFGFDFGGATTPDAVVFNGKIFLFYAGKENPDGTGTRHILLAVSDSPKGVFEKVNIPIVTSHASYIHFDDPVTILSEDEKQIELYYRYANHEKGIYEILRVTSPDGISWSEPIAVLKSDNKIRAYETAHVCRVNVNNESCILLFTFDHFVEGEFKTGLRMSVDGVNFQRDDCVYLDNYWNETIPLCGLQVMSLSKKRDAIEYFGIAKSVNELGHYGIDIYPAQISFKE